MYAWNIVKLINGYVYNLARNKQSMNIVEISYKKILFTSIPQKYTDTTYLTHGTIIILLASPHIIDNQYYFFYIGDPSIKKSEIKVCIKSSTKNYYF